MSIGNSSLHFPVTSQPTTIGTSINWESDHYVLCSGRGKRSNDNYSPSDHYVTFSGRGKRSNDNYSPSDHSVTFSGRGKRSNDNYSPSDHSVTCSGRGKRSNDNYSPSDHSVICSGRGKKRPSDNAIKMTYITKNNRSSTTAIHRHSHIMSPLDRSLFSHNVCSRRSIACLVSSISDLIDWRQELLAVISSLRSVPSIGERRGIWSTCLMWMLQPLVLVDGCQGASICCTSSGPSCDVFLLVCERRATSL